MGLASTGTTANTLNESTSNARKRKARQRSKKHSKKRRRRKRQKRKGTCHANKSLELPQASNDFVNPVVPMLGVPSMQPVADDTNGSTELPISSLMYCPTSSNGQFDGYGVSPSYSTSSYQYPYYWCPTAPNSSFQSDANSQPESSSTPLQKHTHSSRSKKKRKRSSSKPNGKHHHSRNGQLMNSNNYSNPYMFMQQQHYTTSDSSSNQQVKHQTSSKKSSSHTEDSNYTVESKDSFTTRSNSETKNGNKTFIINNINNYYTNHIVDKSTHTSNYIENKTDITNNITNNTLNVNHFNYNAQIYLDYSEKFLKKLKNLETQQALEATNTNLYRSVPKRACKGKPVLEYWKNEASYAHGDDGDDEDDCSSIEGDFVLGDAEACASPLPSELWIAVYFMILLLSLIHIVTVIREY